MKNKINLNMQIKKYIIRNKINEIKVQLVLSETETEEIIFISTSTRRAMIFSVSICTREQKDQGSIDE